MFWSKSRTSTIKQLYRAFKTIITSWCFCCKLNPPNNQPHQWIIAPHFSNVRQLKKYIYILYVYVRKSNPLTISIYFVLLQSHILSFVKKLDCREWRSQDEQIEYVKLRLFFFVVFLIMHKICCSFECLQVLSITLTLALWYYLFDESQLETRKENGGDQWN